MPKVLKPSLATPPSQTFHKQLEAKNLLPSDWLGRIAHPNGKDQKITVKELWELYQADHLPTVNESTRVNKEFRCSKFLPPLYGLRLCELTPQVISELVRFHVEPAKLKQQSRRFNFSKELKDLKGVLNWYCETIDFLYANPIKQHHMKLSIVREIPRKEREITVDQFKKFQSHLSTFHQKLSTAQYLVAGRISELAGLQWKNVDFERRIITIRDIIVWIRGKATLQNHTKTRSVRHVYLSDAMLEILKGQMNERDGDFVFHKKGKPLLYSVINANYNRAWKRAELTQFHGTHITRFFACQRARIVSGSIDGVKSVTGQSIQMAQKYSDFACIEQNRDTIEKMEAALLGFKKVD